MTACENGQLCAVRFHLSLFHLIQSRKAQYSFSFKPVKADLNTALFEIDLLNRSFAEHLMKNPVLFMKRQFISADGNTRSFTDPVFCLTDQILRQFFIILDVRPVNVQNKASLRISPFSALVMATKASLLSSSISVSEVILRLGKIPSFMPARNT